jgi:hypothetical protein
VQQREHRGGVGRTDDRADQQPLGPVQIQDPAGRQARDQAGDQHAEAGERGGGRQRDPKALQAGAHAAVEQDHRQRRGPRQIGQPVIVEDDAAGSVLAGQHADHQEHQQQRHAEARRDHGRQDAEHEQQTGE